jgi:hypothetical protein
VKVITKIKIAFVRAGFAVLREIHAFSRVFGIERIPTDDGAPYQNVSAIASCTQ